MFKVLDDFNGNVGNRAVNFYREVHLRIERNEENGLWDISGTIQFSFCDRETFHGEHPKGDVAFCEKVTMMLLAHLGCRDSDSFWLKWASDEAQSENQAVFEMSPEFCTKFINLPKKIKQS